MCDDPSLPTYAWTDFFYPDDHTFVTQWSGHRLPFHSEMALASRTLPTTSISVRESSFCLFNAELPTMSLLPAGDLPDRLEIFPHHHNRLASFGTRLRVSAPLAINPQVSANSYNTFLPDFSLPLSPTFTMSSTNSLSASSPSFPDSEIDEWSEQDPGVPTRNNVNSNNAFDVHYKIKNESADDNHDDNEDHDHTEDNDEAEARRNKVELTGRLSVLSDAYRQYSPFQNTVNRHKNSTSTHSAPFTNAWPRVSRLMRSESRSAFSTSRTYNPNEIIIGIYTRAERAAKIERYQQKRQRRVWEKKIRYACRKRFADNRPRVKGRFVQLH